MVSENGLMKMQKTCTQHNTILCWVHVFCIFIKPFSDTICHGLHQKTPFVSIRPHSSAHSEDSSTQRPIHCRWPSIRSFTWQGLETSSWSSSRSLDRPTPQRHWICSCQPPETDRPSYGATVERRDGPSWLRDDDDDDDAVSSKLTDTIRIPCFTLHVFTELFVEYLCLVWKVLEGAG